MWTELVGECLYIFETQNAVQNRCKEFEFTIYHLSMGTELVGDRLSRGTNQLGTNCGGSNVRGPHVFGTKCVTAQETIQGRKLFAEILYLFFPELKAALTKEFLTIVQPAECSSKHATLKAIAQ